MQGKSVNGFVLKRLLGTGGMAEVWYAENEIGKPAAVKILSPNLSNSPQIVERFHNEALVMVKLNHSNIRQVYGYGYIDSRHCIIMEYLEGCDLETLLRGGRRFTEEELRRWWNQIAQALNYTHAKGVVHRDIKPSNIFIDSEGNARLTDFGIAKIRENMPLTMSGAMMGTLVYMSPEQVQDSKNVDYRSDVYSLAVTFIHLLTGKAPYDTTTSNDYAILKGIVEEKLDLSPLPTNWRNFLQPYLEKDPQKRPALELISPSFAEPIDTNRTKVSKTSTNYPCINNETVVDTQAAPKPKRSEADDDAVRIPPSLSFVLGIVAASSAGLVIVQAVFWLFYSFFHPSVVWSNFINTTVNIIGLVLWALMLVWFALAGKVSKRKAFSVLALIALSAFLLVDIGNLGVQISRYRFFFGLQQDLYYDMLFVLGGIGRVLLGIAFILMGHYLPERAKKWSITVGIVILAIFVYGILYKFLFVNVLERSVFDEDLYYRKLKIYGGIYNIIAIVWHAFMSVFFLLCAKLGKNSRTVVRS